MFGSPTYVYAHSEVADHIIEIAVVCSTKRWYLPSLLLKFDPSKCLVKVSSRLVTTTRLVLIRHFDGSNLRSKLGNHHRFKDQTTAISMMCSATSESLYFFVGEPNKFDRDLAGLRLKILMPDSGSVTARAVRPPRERSRSLSSSRFRRIG